MRERLLRDTPGVALVGRVWAGAGAAPYDDGMVLLAADGSVTTLGPAAAVEAPEGIELVGGAGCWVGPAVADCHVHLAFGSPGQLLARGVAMCRDLGAPLPAALGFRGDGAPIGRAPGGAMVEVSGPLLTAPGGYPSATWGADGFAAFVTDASDARAAVDGLVAAGVRVVKLAFERRDGTLLDLVPARAAVEAMHAAGGVAVAHALTVETVLRALDANVDELAHVPVEPLPAEIVSRIADAGVTVTSTLATFEAQGQGGTVLANAASLVAAGVPLRYGTDLGNEGTRPGVDPRELELLAAAGLGLDGAARAATAGWWGEPLRLRAGSTTPAVVLRGDPFERASAWRELVAIVVDGRILVTDDDSSADGRPGPAVGGA